MSDSHLLKRLRKRLGLSGLSLLTVASGPCGGCPPDIEPYDECVRLEQLLRWRERAIGWNLDENGDLVCAETTPEIGAAGALGLGGLTQPTDTDSVPNCTESQVVYADSGDAIDRGNLESIRQAAQDWDPELGCPTPGQYQSLQELKTGREYSWEAGRLSSIEGAPDMCCYHAEGGPAHCPGGRPFLVGGSARVARMDQGSLPESSLERAVGHAWLEDALSEHASIAAFARLSLQLMHLGAPMHWVVESQEASLDEARHAEFCLARATLHLGRALRLGSLDMTDALEGLELRDVLVTNIIEGCIGETLAAARARARARRTTDQKLAQGLRKLALDEERHAALAWKILDWALEVGPPELHEIARETFVLQAPPKMPSSRRRDASTREIHAAGCLTREESAALDRQHWESTVLPLAEEVFVRRRPAA